MICLKTIVAVTLNLSMTKTFSRFFEAMRFCHNDDEISEVGLSFHIQ